MIGQRDGALDDLGALAQVARPSCRIARGRAASSNCSTLDAITEARLREIELVAAMLDAGLEVRAAVLGR